MIMEKVVQNMDIIPHLNKPETVVRNVRYSALHPVIPRLYVPPWRMDMQNRDLILEVSFYLYLYRVRLPATQNAVMGGIPTYEHDEPLFLEKREQMSYNSENRNRVDGRYVMASRCELIHPPISHPFYRYKSSLMIRKFGEDPRAPERRPSPK